MARRTFPRNVRPGMSGDPADKLYACLNYRIRKGSAEYQRHPLYFDSCADWYAGLSEDWQDFVTYVIDAWSKWGEEYAKKWAAKLPAGSQVPALDG
jgi:hypothetical protein